jgi:hypothetical protein
MASLNAINDEGFRLSIGELQWQGMKMMVWYIVNDSNKIVINHTECCHIHLVFAGTDILVTFKVVITIDVISFWFDWKWHNDYLSTVFMDFSLQSHSHVFPCSEWLIWHGLSVQFVTLRNTELVLRFE